jgi:hypothetical protein
MRRAMGQSGPLLWRWDRMAQCGEQQAFNCVFRFNNLENFDWFLACVASDVGLLAQFCAVRNDNDTYE